MIVLDASAALELLLRAAEHPGIVDRVLRSGETIAAHTGFREGLLGGGRLSSDAVADSVPHPVT
jgi:hypothetical protein